MRAVSPRDRMLLVVWTAAVVVLAVVVGLVLPVRGRRSRLNSDIVRLQQQIAEASAMYRQAPELRMETKELRETAQALSRSGKDVSPVMIREVDRLTKDLGISLLSIRPGEPETLEGCSKYTAVFEVECDFPRVARMLYELERPPLHLWVEGAEISSDRTAENVVRAKVSVAVYTLPQQSAPALGGRAPLPPGSASEKRNEKG